MLTSQETNELPKLSRDQLYFDISLLYQGFILKVFHQTKS
jgi:hypothetical protein